MAIIEHQAHRDGAIQDFSVVYFLVTYLPFCSPCTGEGQEVHANSGQPENQRHRGWLHEQKMLFCHFQS